MHSTIAASAGSPLRLFLSDFDFSARLAFFTWTQNEQRREQDKFRDNRAKSTVWSACISIRGRRETWAPKMMRMYIISQCIGLSNPRRGYIYSIYTYIFLLLSSSVMSAYGTAGLLCWLGVSTPEGSIAIRFLRHESLHNEGIAL